MSTAVAFKSPLHEMTQTTPTCLWNDFAAFEELTYSLEHGAVGATCRKAEAETADAAVARHAAMADDNHVFDALRRKDIGIKAGLLNNTALDERTGDNRLVERLVFDCGRPGVPDIVLVEDRRVIRIEPAEDDQVLSARRRVVDQHAADAVEMVGDADDCVRPSRRIRDGTIDVVEQALVVHQRPAPLRSEADVACPRAVVLPPGV